jgi:cytochrome c oxidase assembly protein subunit 15
VLTACAALPLVTLGAEVTTRGVGMVDSQGFRAPWYLFTLDSDQLYLGYLIEHGHRLAGFIVGTACIVLAIGMTLQARGLLHRSLGWVALAAVSLQGVLGIFRVELHRRGLGSSLALLHGCSAQLVFATLVAVAVLSSRAWSEATWSVPVSLRAGSIGFALLVYTQVVFGAMLRHRLDPLAQRLHVLLAFAVVFVLTWLIDRLMRSEADRAIRRTTFILAVLVLLQPILGVEAWIRRFGSGELPDLVHSSLALDLARSGHQVVGTLIFATSVALVVVLYRRPAVWAEGVA